MNNIYCTFFPLKYVAFAFILARGVIIKNFNTSHKQIYIYASSPNLRNKFVFNAWHFFINFFLCTFQQIHIITFTYCTYIHTYINRGLFSSSSNTTGVVLSPIKAIIFIYQFHRCGVKSNSPGVVSSRIKGIIFIYQCLYRCGVQLYQGNYLHLPLLQVWCPVVSGELSSFTSICIGVVSSRIYLHLPFPQVVLVMQWS